MALVHRRDLSPPDRPVLILALEGWIDAGFAAATATATIMEQIATEELATFAGGKLIDQRARRPRLRIQDGVRVDIEWPEPQLRVGKDALGNGVAILVGPEPDYRWRSFSSEVTKLAKELNVQLVVGLGAFPTATPHTRVVRLAATASNSELASQVGFVPGLIDVPAGIGDVIGTECAEAGIPSVGLWARVPHYVAGMAFAPAALALIDGLASVAGLVVDADELRDSAEMSRARVDELISQSSEHLAMVRRLEEQLDESDELQPPDGEVIPSGDEIAAELERFLRGET